MEGSGEGEDGEDRSEGEGGVGGVGEVRDLLVLRGRGGGEDGERRRKGVSERVRASAGDTQSHDRLCYLVLDGRAVRERD